MKTIVVVLAALILSSCATILNQDTQSINILTSNNSKVKFTVQGMQYSAPAIVSLRRSEQDAIIQVSGDKCTPQVLLTSKVDSKFWINILTGGTFGSTTDYSTEKMWRYDDSVTLMCK